MTTGHAGRRSGFNLAGRYSASDLSVFDAQERRRFLRGGADVLEDALAWELMYRLEPELFDRLVTAETLHPAILEWLPPEPGAVLEIGAGTGRLTLPLAARSQAFIAVEPAAPLRRILQGKLERAGLAERVRVVRGFFDCLPVDGSWADLVVACSSLTPEPGHGGDAGLAEMERCCRPGGRIVIIWPNHLPWLAAHGYEYRSFAGDMSMSFVSPDEAIELAEVFYPDAVDEIRRRGTAEVPYEVLGVQPPRDVAFKRKGP